MGNPQEDYQIKAIPTRLVERSQKYRQALIEIILEQDENLATKYLEGQELKTEEIKQLLRKAVLSGRHFAVFCGSAYKHVGVNLLLDGVVDYLPSPLDIAEIPVFPLYPGKEPKKAEIQSQISQLEKDLQNLNQDVVAPAPEKQTSPALSVVKFELEEKLIELKKQLKTAENKSAKINCNSPLSCLALAFKIVFDDRNQRITFIRVYAGKISAGS